ncbi:MAG: HAD hydrolase-like protein, partial [Anaerolineae bacterium]|nr:HAD hydrolase-like protein [Anaerolineae bacterium]
MRQVDMRDIQAIIFDFDYTLADSSEGIVRCANYALTELGFEPASGASIRRTIGLALDETFLALTGQRDRQAMDAFGRLFIERADQIMVAHTVLLPGVREAVARLRALSLPLAIVSTKFRYRIATTLRREGLKGDFPVIVGGEDVRAFKPDPEGLLMGARQLGSRPGAICYVGDSLTDARAAQLAGMPFVGVLSGVTPASAFDGLPRRALLPGVHALP